MKRQLTTSSKWFKLDLVRISDTSEQLDLKGDALGIYKIHENTTEKLAIQYCANDSRALFRDLEFFEHGRVHFAQVIGTVGAQSKVNERGFLICRCLRDPKPIMALVSTCGSAAFTKQGSPYHSLSAPNKQYQLQIMNHGKSLLGCD